MRNTVLSLFGGLFELLALIEHLYPDDPRCTSPKMAVLRIQGVSCISCDMRNYPKPAFYQLSIDHPLALHVVDNNSQQD